MVKIHAATKKRILLFGRMRAKSLVDIFRQMGYIWYILPQNGLFFAILYRSYDAKSVDRLHRGDLHDSLI